MNYTKKIGSLAGESGKKFPNEAKKTKNFAKRVL
jgi:hypothetical protein